MENKNKQENKKEIEELVIARLEVLPQNISISIGSEGKYTRDELIKEIRNDTPIGQKMIEIDLTYLRKLKEGILYATYSPNH